MGSVLANPDSQVLAAIDAFFSEDAAHKPLALRSSLAYSGPFTEGHMRILVTGVAGFIGYHLAKRLLQEGYTVAGIDNFDAYYDVQLKKDRIADIMRLPAARDNFLIDSIDLADAQALASFFSTFGPSHVVNLAGQAGVRHSLENPAAYVSANLTGFANLLECCRQWPVAHLLYASTSSVYGLNAARPYGERQTADHPVSLYAATKKSNELMAHAYSHLFGIACTGLRFFTVYGPWGRPDMAAHLFTSAILQGRPIQVFNQGQMQRDFTYIDDIVEGIVRLLPVVPAPDPAFDPASPDPATSSAPWRIYNIGNSTTVELNDFISQLEQALGMTAKREYLPMQAGDVQSTLADVSALSRVTGFAPHTPLHEGLARYVAWHREYYRQ